MILKRCIAAIALIPICAMPTNARNRSNFPDLEQKLGRGWQCFAMPNGFGRVGVIFEQRQDKSVFYLDDTKLSAAATAPMAIGSLTTSKHFSIGAAVKFLATFFPSLDVSHDYNRKISATIGGAEEQVGGIAAQDAAKSWASRHLSAFSSGSKVFVVREAVLASEVTYTFDSATSTSIAAKLDLSASKTATVAVSGPGQDSKPSATVTTSTSPVATGGSGSGGTGDIVASTQTSTVAPPDASHRIAQTFNPKIGVCIHPDQILVGNNYGGRPQPRLLGVTEDLGLRVPEGGQ